MSSEGPAPVNQATNLRSRLAELDGASESELVDGLDSRLVSIQHLVRARVQEEAGARLGLNVPEEERERELQSLIDEILAEQEIRVSPTGRRQLVRQVLSDTLGFGPLDELMADHAVSEIMCNGHDTIYVERHGMIELTDLRFADEAHLRTVINRIARIAGRRIDESSPMVDARMPDGSRMNAILPPLSLVGPVLTIRRFPGERLTPETLIKLGSCTAEAVDALAACVRGKLNIIVSGGTGSGKTTVLNVLSSFISERERLITIEDSAELQLNQPHVISLESRPSNTEGEGLVTIRDLVRNALRMRPDRLIIGECRSGEAFDMLQAMNTGHDGSLTTVHANTARDALRRLEMMVVMAGYEIPIWAVREQMASTIHLIVQLERLPDGRRVVQSMTEVQSLEEDAILMQDLFVYDPSVHRVVPTGMRPRFAALLERRGVAYPRRARVIAGAVLVAVGVLVITVGIASQIAEQRHLRSFVLGEAPVRSRFRVWERARTLRPDWELLIWIGAGLVTVLASYVLFGQAIVALVVAAVAFVIVLAMRERRRRGRVDLMRTQFSDAVASLSSSLAAGNTFMRSFQEMASNTAQPMRTEFERVVAEVDLGFPVSTAMEALAGRTGLEDARWLAHVLRLHETMGAPVSGLLQQLSTMVREADGFAREVRALTAEGRMGGYVVAALPAFLVVFLEVSQPGYLDVFSTGWGIVASLAMVASVIGGLMLIQTMVRSVEA